MVLWLVCGRRGCRSHGASMGAARPRPAYCGLGPAKASQSQAIGRAGEAWLQPARGRVQADDVAVVDGGARVGDEVAEPQHASGVDRLRAPSACTSRDRRGCARGASAVRRGRIVHVIVIGSSPRPVNTIRPPSRRSTVMSASNGSHQSASRAGSVIASQTSRIGEREVPFEADDAAVGGAFQRAVVGGGRLFIGRSFVVGVDGCGGAVEVPLEGVEPRRPIGLGRAPATRRAR